MVIIVVDMFLTLSPSGRTVTLRGVSEINDVVDEIFKLEDTDENGFVDMSEFSGPKKGKHDEL